jgi:hypothetical protein
LREKITQVIVEGDNVCSSLHSWAGECRELFNIVYDWVGLLERHNKPVNELHAQLNQLNAEAQAIDDPIEQQAKFAKIQAVDEKMDVLHEATQVANKDLLDFRLAFQSLLMSNYNTWIQLPTPNGMPCRPLSLKSPLLPRAKNLLQVHPFLSGNGKKEWTNTISFASEQCRSLLSWALYLRETAVRKRKVDSGRVNAYGRVLLGPPFLETTKF